MARLRCGNGFTAALRGKLVAYDGTLKLDVDQVTSWPGSLRVRGVDREIELAVPSTTMVFDSLGMLLAENALSALKSGTGMVAWTEKTGATIEAALGEPSVLATQRIELGAIPS